MHGVTVCARIRRQVPRRHRVAESCGFSRMLQRSCENVHVNSGMHASQSGRCLCCGLCQHQPQTLAHWILIGMSNQAVTDNGATQPTNQTTNNSTHQQHILQPTIHEPTKQSHQSTHTNRLTVPLSIVKWATRAHTQSTS